MDQHNMAEKLCGEEGNSEEQGELHVVRTCRTTKEMSLDLSQRKLKGIPMGVFELSHIQYLYIGDNLLEELPLELAENLIQLTWLDVRRNKLTSLPCNISLLKSLKHLLLEGNQIKNLPLELGLLKHLTGLNLKENPLEFPPKNIIAQGSKVILKYLREQFDVSCQMHHLNLQEPNSEENQNKIGEDISDSERDNGSHYSYEDISGYSEFRDTPDRSTSGKYLPSLRKLNLHSAPHLKYARPESSISENYSERDSGYMRREPIEVRYIREVEDAERKKFNDKVDAIIQKQRNKVALDDWRKETGKLQREKRRSRSTTKHEIKIPYGNDIPDPKKMEKDKTNDLMDVDLEERIKEHVRNIKEWRMKDKRSLTTEEELATAKQNLEKAQQLQEMFDKKRTTELRSNAFNANDYIPSSNPISKYRAKK